MNEDAKKFLERADEALESASILHEAAHYLDAVSRAYYAMYHAAMAALSTVNVPVKTHKGAINQFYQHFIASGKLPAELGRSFSYAFEKRTSGDYEVYFELDETDSAKILRDAQFFLSSIRSFLDSF